MSIEEELTPPGPPLYSFSGKAGEAGVWPTRKGTGYEVWFQGVFVGEFSAEKQAIGAAEKASEEGLDSAPDEPEPAWTP